MEYKTVAGPIGLKIKGKKAYEDAVRTYASIIDAEAVGGWEFVCIQEIPVEKDKGFFIAGLLAMIGIGSRYEYVRFNMLVFVRKTSK